jgi:hypothetical protein
MVPPRAQLFWRAQRAVVGKGELSIVVGFDGRVKRSREEGGVVKLV